MSLLINFLLLSVSIFIVASLLEGIKIKGFVTAMVIALVFSVLNLLIGWLLVLLTLPLIIITFGLFKFVINAVILWFTDLLVDDFKIRDFKTTLIAAFLIAVCDSLLKWLLK